MALNKVKIHQAFYGEVNRSHSCIVQTIEDSDLSSFLIAFTDRPAALPPGVALEPYISGCPFGGFYILTKTIPDDTATRAGMVFTHALILNLGDIHEVDDIDDLLSLFVGSTNKKSEELVPVEIEGSEFTSHFAEGYLPAYIQQTIASYLSGGRPILFTGSNEEFSNAIRFLWGSPSLETRKSLKFRVSFTPSDIVNSTGLTIALIQPSFLSKWKGRNIIDGVVNEAVRIISPAEASFLGWPMGEPFREFLVELGAEKDVANWPQYEGIFNDFTQLQGFNNGDLIRQDIRALAKLAPAPALGARVKKAFVDRLFHLIENKVDSNLKALRNIDWRPFGKLETNVSELVGRYITFGLELPETIDEHPISELINLAIDEEPKNWWHKAVLDAARKIFDRPEPIALSRIWRLIDESDERAKKVFSLIVRGEEGVSALINSLPDDLNPRTYDTLLTISKTRNLYLLHARILEKREPVEFAIKQQIDLENDLPLDQSVGFSYLAKSLSDKQLVILAVDSCESKLVDLSVQAILRDSSLLKDFEPKRGCWLKIWTRVAKNSGKIFDGLAGRERDAVTSVLDTILDGEAPDSFILDLIANTEFADISDHPRRKELWAFMHGPTKDRFLLSTVPNVLADLLTERVESSSIEGDLAEIITSDSHMTVFLSDNRSNIGPVLRLYESFKDLKDGFLSDYIRNYNANISESEATRLGVLVVQKGYKKSARSVSDKAHYDRSFKVALDICEGLVDKNWLESMWGSVGSIFSPTKSGPPASRQTVDVPDPELIRNLPTVVILTAINVEYMAVRAHLIDVLDASTNDTSYEGGIFELNGRRIAKVFIRECGAKNNIAAQETERAISIFKPQVILFVGIAGSRKPNDFGIGDVIIPEKVYSYEGGKSERDSFLARPDFADMSYTLLELAKKERRADHWKQLIKGDVDAHGIKANLGVIASGESLVEHYDSDIGQILTKHYNDTSAVEMEGFGFAKAASRQGQMHSSMLTGVIRGISDVLEQPTKRSKRPQSDRRPDNAKSVASDAAAAFAYWLVFRHFDK